MPYLTIKAAAKFLNGTEKARARLLKEQKYPKSDTQQFKTTHYSPTIVGIRDYFRTHHSSAAIIAAKEKIKNIKNEPRRVSNSRALEAFLNSDLSHFQLENIKCPSFKRTEKGIDFKFTPEFTAEYEGELSYFILHLSKSRLKGELARQIVDIAHWILEFSEGEPTISSVFYVDVPTNIFHRFNRRRKSTIDLVISSCPSINKLWNSL